MGTELGSLNPINISIIALFFFQTPHNNTLPKELRAAILILDFLLTRGSKRLLAKISEKCNNKA